jgi:hypothetical protein
VFGFSGVVKSICDSDLPLADQLRLYRDLPHLIGRAPEELDWQRLAIEEFFRDDSPDDAVYDSI